MKLSKPIKVIVGLATAWIVIYPLLFLAIWFLMAFGIFFSAGFQAAEASEVPPPAMLPFGLFFGIFPVHCLTILLNFALIPFYLIHVIKNTAAAEAVRIILGVGIFFMGFIAMPVYFYLYIWREQPPAWALEPATRQGIEAK
jgi:hypothetical protein